MQISAARSGYHLRSRARAAGLHLLVSLLVAGSVGPLVLLLWYPYPFSEISGGRELFLIVMTVDVIMGPLITLAIFDRRKPRRELVTDFSVIALLQVLALCYGLWTVLMARPVHLVFEFDRLRVVHRIDVDPAELSRASPHFQRLPLSGPGLLAVRPFRDAAEQADATLAALSGIDLAARPGLWEPYDVARSRISAAAKPLSDLVRRFPEQRESVEEALAGGTTPSTTALYLPMVGRESFWTAILDPSTMRPVAFLPIDSF